MPRQKATPQRATAEGLAARQREPTYEERIGRALRDMYPDNSSEAYGDVLAWRPGYRYPAGFVTPSDQERFDSYTHAQRERAQRYHNAFVNRHIIGLLDGDLHAAQFVQYQGHKQPLREIRDDNMLQFADEWAAPSAQYARRYRLNVDEPIVPPTAAEPRNARPVRERSPEADGD